MSDRAYRFGPWQLVPGEILLRDGERQAVSPKELAALSLLVERAGLIVSKEELVRGVWRDEAVSDDSVARCIYGLRKTLDESSEQRFIETVPRRGFRFTAPVSIEKGVARRGNLPLRIAVLPFDSSDEDLRADAHLELTAALTRASSPGVQVLARTITAGLSPSGPERQRMADDLQLDYAVSGAIRRTGDRVRMRAELIHIRDGAQIWTAAFEGSEGALDHSYAEAARAVLGAIQLPEAGSGATATPARPDPEVYERYLRARHCFLQRTPDKLRLALDLYRAVLALDPRFVPALVDIADIHVSQAAWGLTWSRPAGVKARESLDAALAIAPDSAVAHGLYGVVLSQIQRDYEAAEKHFELARGFGTPADLDPTFRLYYGRHLLSTGRADAAIAQVEAALAVDPYAKSLAAFLPYAYFCARRFQEAVLQIERTRLIANDLPAFHGAAALVLSEVGEHVRAVEAGKMAVQLSGGAVTPLADYAWACARAGDVDTASEVLARVLPIAREQNVAPSLFAPVAAIVGGPAEALWWLRLAREQACLSYGLIIADPRFDRLRTHPEFADLRDEYAAAVRLARTGARDSNTVPVAIVPEE